MKIKNNSYIIILIFLILLCIGIGYAAINRTLSITGNSEVKQNTWDVHFENIFITPGSVEAVERPTINNDNLLINFKINLDLPGDFYEFTVDVVNDGTIDAMVESIVKTLELTDVQKKYMNYIIEYQNGEKITFKQLVEKDSFVRIKVRVEYRKDLLESELPTVFEELNLGFIINYVQSDNNGVLVKYNGVIGANGDINEIGTIVTIGTEKFYTIGTEGDNVKLLSMYNLYVGGVYNNGWIKYGEEATGKQSFEMLGYVDGQLIRKGTTAFSSDEQKGINYSDYNGSIVEEYVNNYKDILEEDYGINVIDARLITYAELINSKTFSCVENARCSDRYPWIYSTSYWAGSAYDPTIICYINSSVKFSDTFYNYNNILGVRPVIVVSKYLF